jgi:hypothetical protein
VFLERASKMNHGRSKLGWRAFCGSRFLQIQQLCFFKCACANLYRERPVSVFYIKKHDLFIGVLESLVKEVELSGG